MPTHPKSLTHQHLLSVVCTECRRRAKAPRRHLRLLDLGCGNGALLGYLSVLLPAQLPDWQIELHGCDVGDSRVQEAGFLDQAIATLAHEQPGVPWPQRIARMETGSPWPYPDSWFDAIVSNQVLEHVHDLGHVFAEMRRTLRPDGFGVHLFPLRHCLLEGHLLLPLAHRVGDHDLLRWYIAWWSRVGMGKYRAHRRANGTELAEFAERHADYLHYFTHYVKHRELLQLGKRHHLRLSLRYTRELYSSKVRALLRRPPRYFYSTERWPPGDALAALLLRYISGITLLVTRRQTY